MTKSRNVVRQGNRDLKVGGKPREWCFEQLMRCWPPHGPVNALRAPVPSRVERGMHL